MDLEIKKDYLLLRNYQENIFSMREILLKDSMNSIRNIESDTFSLVVYQGSEKIKLKSIFQMHIISQINAVVLPAGFTTITTSNGGFEFVTLTAGDSVTVQIGLS